MTNKEITGRDVRRIRKELGYNQATFALALGYKRAATISEIECGTLSPSQPALLLLSHLILLSRIEANTRRA